MPKFIGALVGVLLQLGGALALAAPGILTQATAGSDPQELVFLTWPDYMDPSLVEEFEQSRGVKIRMVYFETDDDRDEILVKTDGRGFDLAVVNSPNFPVYVRSGWLAPVGPAEVPNLRHIHPRWLDAVPEAQGFGVPYFWGTTGIAYRSDLIPEGIQSWRQFFAPPEAWRGRIGLTRNARDIIGMALKSLGASANSTDTEQIRAAGDLVRQQVPYLGEIGYISLDADCELASGKLWAAMMYSGDALMVKQYHPDIVYTVPVEGGEIWIDYLAILQSSASKALAADFIDFLNHPPRAAKNALFVRYAPPNRAAESLLPREFREDPVIYPGRTVLAKSEYFVDLPAETVRLRNSVYGGILEAWDVTRKEVSSLMRRQ